MSAKRYNMYVLVASVGTLTEVMYAIVLLAGGSTKRLQSAWMSARNFVMTNGMVDAVTRRDHYSSADPNAVVLKALLGEDIANVVQLQILLNSFVSAKAVWVDQISLKTWTNAKCGQMFAKEVVA